jgi:hypothetical protein
MGKSYDITNHKYKWIIMKNYEFYQFFKYFHKHTVLKLHHPLILELYDNENHNVNEILKGLINPLELQYLSEYLKFLNEYDVFGYFREIFYPRYWWHNDDIEEVIHDLIFQPEIMEPIDLKCYLKYLLKQE